MTSVHYYRQFCNQHAFRGLVAKRTDKREALKYNYYVVTTKNWLIPGQNEREI